MQDHGSGTPSAPPVDASRLLLELQGLLLNTRGLEEFLHDLTALAVQALAPPTSCGITLQPDRHLYTAANSDEVAANVDEIQYRTGEGPCLVALREGEEFYIPEMAVEQRWPRFARGALALGIHSTLSLPLTLPTGTVGVLNLYSTERDPYDEEACREAGGFALQAAGAVGVAMRLAAEATVSSDLREALAFRSVIDQALGIIMAERRCDSRGAFEILRRASRNRNVKLRAVAAGIVEGVSGKPPASTPFYPREGRHLPGGHRPSGSSPLGSTAELPKTSQ